MSMLLMVEAMKAKVGNPIRKLVLMKLADNASDDGFCWPSYQNIADHCECSRGAVKQHIKALEAAGFLRIRNRSKDGVKASNIYYLTIDQGRPEELPKGRPAARFCVARSTEEEEGGGSPDDPGVGHQMTQGGSPDDLGVGHQMTIEPVTTEPVIEPEGVARKRASPPAKTPTKKRRSSVPDNFEITDDMRAWFQAKQVPGDIREVTDAFLDHHTATGSMFVDWRKAWQTWCRNEIKFNKGRSHGNQARFRDPDAPQISAAERSARAIAAVRAREGWN